MNYPERNSGFRYDKINLGLIAYSNIIDNSAKIAGIISINNGLSEINYCNIINNTQLTNTWGLITYSQTNNHQLKNSIIQDNKISNCLLFYYHLNIAPIYISNCFIQIPFNNQGGIFNTNLGITNSYNLNFHFCENYIFSTKINIQKKIIFILFNFLQ